MEEQLHLESQQNGLKEMSYPSQNSGLFYTKSLGTADFLVSARCWRGGENALFW